MGNRSGTQEMPGSELQERNTTKKETRPDHLVETILLSHSSTLTSEDTNSKRHTSKEDSARLQSCWWVVAAMAFFTILDCLLIALLLTVSVDLARLQQNSSLSSSVKNVSISSTTTSQASTSGLLEDSAFCLPCSDVYLGEVEILQNRRPRVRKRKEEEELDGGHLCCAEPHDDLKTLVGDMFIRIHYERDRAKGVVKVAANDTDDNDDVDDQSDVIKPHILLQLDTEAEPKEVNGTHAVPLKVSKREAPAPSDHNQTSSSAFFHEGVVKIAHPGHFYIHSLVPFNFHLDKPVILTQYVYHVRNGGETLLLENSVYPCDVSVQNCEHSFVGGLFLLERGDEVVLRVSSHSCVAKERKLEFGVHRL